MKIVLVGAGASNIFLALNLLERGYEVHLFEKTNSMGKKFLVAGKSGLNITHSENIQSFHKKYFNHKDLFLTLLEDFSNDDLIKWLGSFGIQTYVGSSKRVFPTKLKASEILKMWKDKLHSFRHFYFYPNHTLTHIGKRKVTFNHKLEVDFQKIVYALGGASWARTGSDGKWIQLFDKHQVKSLPFQSLNCGMNIDWSDRFKENLDFLPIKNVQLTLGAHKFKGDLMLTQYGIEGTPVYSLSRYVKYHSSEHQTLFLDLKPDMTIEQIQKKLIPKRSKDTLSNHIRKSIGLKGVYLKLIYECVDQATFKQNIAQSIKACPLTVTSLRPIEEAISTSGGIALEELDHNFMLKKLPDHYVAGEMVDWDTITGGYLLQGCYSISYRIQKAIIAALPVKFK